MENIKATLENVMQALERKKKRASQENPQALLEQALNKKELKHIKLNYFKKGVLSLRVDSSSWLYQLNLKKTDLLARLSRERLAVRDIRFQLGGMKRPEK